MISSFRLLLVLVSLGYVQGAAGGWYWASCRKSSDCTYDYSSCVSGQCKCNKNYKYDPSVGKCVSECGILGDNFVLYTPFAIAGHNDVTLKTTGGFKECSALCLAESITTLSIDFNKKTGACKCSKSAPGMDGVKVGKYEDYTMAVRQCGVPPLTSAPLECNYCTKTTNFDECLNKKQRCLPQKQACFLGMETVGDVTQFKAQCKNPSNCDFVDGEKKWCCEGNRCNNMSLTLTHESTSADMYKERKAAAVAIERAALPINWYGGSCTKTKDCTFDNSQCVTGVCRCDMEHRYDPSTSTCVSQCDHLGDEFTVYNDNVAVRGHDDRSSETTSFAECSAFCLAESITTLSIDFKESKGRCICSASAPGMSDVFVGYFDGYSMAVRQCGAPPRCSKQLDLAFLVDTSRSISDQDLDRAMTFVDGLAQRFSVSATETRVSVVQFSHRTLKLCCFKDDMSNGDVSKCVDDQKMFRGSSKTNIALRYEKSAIFTSECGAREGSVQALVVMTDGKADHPDATLTRAQALKDEGVKIVGVTMGQLEDAERDFVTNVASAGLSFQDQDLMENMEAVAEALCGLA